MSVDDQAATQWRRDHSMMLDGGRWAPPIEASQRPPDVRSRRRRAGLEAAGRRAEAAEGSLLDVPTPALEKPRHLAARRRWSPEPCPPTGPGPVMVSLCPWLVTGLVSFLTVRRVQVMIVASAGERDG